MALPTYTPHASWTLVDYTSSFVTATATERCSVFFPTGFTPGTSAAVPAMVFIDNAGFNSGTVASSIDPSAELTYEALSKGLVVVYATVCQTKDVADGGPSGAGTFKPPIAAPTEWNSLTQPSFAKSAIHLIQWIKENAAALSIDPNQLYTAGRSGGAAPAMWVALGPDWADPSISTAGQFRAGISSRVAGCCVFQLHSWWRAHDQDVVPQEYASKASNANEVANFGTDVSSAVAIRVSPMHYAVTESVYPGIQTTNSTARVFFYSPGPVFSGLSTPATETDFELNASTGLPTIFDVITAFHDGWHPIALWRRLSALNPEFYRKNGRCVFDSASVTTDYGHTHTVDDESDAYRMMVEWIRSSAGLLPEVPLSEQILREVIVRMKKITQGATYYHTPAKVTRGIGSMFGGPYPAISVTPVSDEYSQVGEQHVESLSSRMRISISFLHESAALGTQWSQETVSDIKTALFTDQQLNGLAIDTQLVSVDFLHAEDPSSGLCGADMEWEITYRTPHLDYTYPR